MCVDVACLRGLYALCAERLQRLLSELDGVRRVLQEDVREVQRGIFLILPICRLAQLVLHLRLARLGTDGQLA